MKVLKLNTPFEISAVVRTALSSELLIFTARNENTGLTTNYTLDFWSHINGRLNFFLPDTNPDFKAGNKYEITIINTIDDSIIYRGKMIIATEETDTQNYTPSKQTTPRFL